MLADEKNIDVIIPLLYGVRMSNRYIKVKEIDLLLTFVGSENKDIRSAAVSALSCIDNMKAIRGLIALSQDRYSYIRNWATFGIGTLSDLDNDEVRQALYARCTDRHHETRMEAISGLAKRKDDGVKKYLEKEFADCTVYVLESIQNLGAKEYLPRLEAMLEEAGKNPDIYNNEYWLRHLKECVEKLRCTC
jgi:HEAT repeat protein